MPPSGTGKIPILLLTTPEEVTYRFTSVTPVIPETFWLPELPYRPYRKRNFTSTAQPVNKSLLWAPTSWYTTLARSEPRYWYKRQIKKGECPCPRCEPEFVYVRPAPQRTLTRKDIDPRPHEELLALVKGRLDTSVQDYRYYLARRLRTLDIQVGPPTMLVGYLGPNTLDRVKSLFG
ncbi:hypothetical protein BJ508DRAFT_313397 [Ascobolus immersus RN42]|uniref:Uncharacterized protein n=1 Tax=Ascobolus immersus RN42 TaxID=1160509 RepID=A0A3N4HIX8_ASCIM|nr:hypothetical protein BJ508DRAFT_313397 [Ascobolus immersus RN42]